MPFGCSGVGGRKNTKEKEEAPRDWATYYSESEAADTDQPQQVKTVDAEIGNKNH